jgi:hypothetical protein
MIGNGRTSKIIGGLGNIVTLGNAGWGIGGDNNSSAHPIPEFKPIMSYYDSSEPISSLDGHPVVKPYSSEQHFFPEDTRELMSEFKPNNTRSPAVTNEGQHVDASKKKLRSD